MKLLRRRPHQQLPRAVVKTLGYRLFMVAITVGVAFLVVGNTAEALSIGLIANVVKTGTYFAYERAWDRVDWGV
ncbi:MAG: putative membrane protein [Natronomonas sp.]|jgi:uncharacterized membrane protein|uniref:DUF2061 domain-containing protein n=1 Tax=Natronomonas sp. TaxID=2184060 RepID=UPI0039890F02